MIRKTGIILIILLISLSCEQSIEVELPPVVEKIAVKGLFSTDKVFSLEISHSKHIFDTTSTFHLDKVVVDFYENETFIETLENKGFIFGRLKCVSPSGFKCNEKSTYSINVYAPGFGTTFAENTIPEPVQILMVDTSTVIAELPGWYFGHLGPYNQIRPLLECRIRFNDLPDVQNYYTLQVETQTGQLPYVSYDQIVELLLINEDAICGWEYIYHYKKICFSDKLIDGEDYELVILLDKELLRGKTYFKLYSLSREYYFYKKSVMQSIDSQLDLFAEPVQVYTNIQNGVGIFAGASVSVDSSIVFPP
jgi:hypothetical protein